MATTIKKPKTNVQFVKELMEHSQYGALAQVFIIQAIDQFSKSVAAKKASDFPENDMVHIPSWIGVGKEIHQKMEDHLGR